MPFQLEFISEQATRGVRELQHVQCKHPPQCMTWAVSGFRISCFPCTNPPQRTIANHPFWNLKRKEKQHVKTTETKNKKPTNRKHIWNCMLHLERTFGNAYWDISYCLGSLPLLKTHCIALNKKMCLEWHATVLFWILHFVATMLQLYEEYDVCSEGCLSC